MKLPSDTLGIVLAGGVGSRLSPLTNQRAKPAVPFGGRYRIIDFTLSNCVNSGLRRILVLTQYKSQSLNDHLQNGWSFLCSQMGDYITAIPPQMRTGNYWYRGTADAVYQNLYLVKRSNAKNVAILSGDHIYRMDYSDMLRQHEALSADVTVACIEVGLQSARSFGVMTLDSELRVHDFQEKPLRPNPEPNNPRRALVSMGVYIFSADVLHRELTADHADLNSSHDFGKDILPRLIHTHRVFGYRFNQQAGENGHAYWRDVGTIDAYYHANMDLLKNPAPLDVYDQDWPIRTADVPAAPARVAVDLNGNSGEVHDSILNNGVVVDGGIVRHSILSNGVRVTTDAAVRDSVLFDNVTVGRGATLQNCIVDRNVHIPAGTEIGLNPNSDAKNFTVSASGVVVVPAGSRFPSPELMLPAVRRKLAVSPVSVQKPAGIG